MNVVWYYDKFVQRNTGEIQGNRGPAVANDLTKWSQYGFGFVDSRKDIFLSVAADRNEMKSARGIVEVWETNGVMAGVEFSQIDLESKPRQAGAQHTAPVPTTISDLYVIVLLHALRSFYTQQQQGCYQLAFDDFG